MNRRKARTEADALEVLLATLDVLEGEEAIVPSKDTDPLISKVNKKLVEIGSSCVALPTYLYSAGVDCTKEGIYEDEAKKREGKTRRGLIQIAKARTICQGHTEKEIQELNRPELETLRRSVCSVEHHGVPFTNKVLYHSCGSGPWSHSEETMEMLSSIGIVTKDSSRPSNYTFFLKKRNEAKTAIKKRMLELRSESTGEKPKEALKKEAKAVKKPQPKKKKEAAVVEPKSEEPVRVSNSGS